MIWLLLLCVEVSVLGLGVYLWLESRRYSHIPGDLGLPVIGNLRQLASSILFGSIEDLLKKIDDSLDRHGDVSCFWVGPFVFLAVADPELVQGVCYSPATVNKEGLVYDKLNDFCIGGFTKSQSDSEWRHYRKLINKSMRRERVEQYAVMFGRRSPELVAAMAEQAGTFDVHPLAMLLAIDLSVEASFGLEFHELDNKNFGLYQEMTKMEHILANMMSNPLYFLFAKQLIRYHLNRSYHIHDFGRRYLEALMENAKRFEGGDDSDVPQGVDVILSNTREGVGLERTINELRELAFVGGTTTGELLAVLLLLLAIFPEVQDRVWAELKDIFADSDRAPTLEDLNQMHYLKMTVKEAARIAAGPVLPRRCTQDVKIGKYQIPRNSTLLMCSRRLRMDPRYWDRPAEFYPAHFLPEKVAARPRSADISFGVLPRHCPGAKYTTDMMKAVVSTVLRKFTLSSPLTPKDLVFHPVIMMSLNRPYLISCKPRSE